MQSYNLHTPVGFNPFIPCHRMPTLLQNPEAWKVVQLAWVGTILVVACWPGFFYLGKFLQPSSPPSDPQLQPVSVDT